MEVKVSVNNVLMKLSRVYNIMKAQKTLPEITKKAEDIENKLRMKLFYKIMLS